MAIVACGIMVSKALRAAESLEGKGVSARVVNLSSIKPIDVKTIIKAAKDTGAILTCEEHTIMGGLGSAVAEVVCKIIRFQWEWLVPKILSVNQEKQKTFLKNMDLLLNILKKKLFVS